jgi:hypothetical protein
VQRAATFRNNGLQHSETTGCNIPKQRATFRNNGQHSETTGCNIPKQRAATFRNNGQHSNGYFLLLRLEPAERIGLRDVAARAHRNHTQRMQSIGVRRWAARAFEPITGAHSRRRVVRVPACGNSVAAFYSSRNHNTQGGTGMPMPAAMLRAPPPRTAT